MRLSIVFRKGEEARLLSHLDLLATLEYSLRRARLPVELSEGFTPRPRMSLAAALPLGHIGERELLEIGLREDVDPAEVKRRLQSAVPAGIEIRSVDLLAPGQKPAAARLEGMTYRIELGDPVADLALRVEALLARQTLEAGEERNGRRRTRDLRPYLLSARAEGGAMLCLHLKLDGGGTLRPEQALEAMGIATTGARLTRLGLELSD